MNVGKPLGEAKGDVGDSVSVFRHIAKQLEESADRLGLERTPALTETDLPGFAGAITYHPVGPSLGICPFNYPLLMTSMKVAPAIATGCSIIIKPNDTTPFSTLEMAHIASECGLPAGVLNVIVGDGSVAERVMTDPRIRKLSFTGSDATGAKVFRAASDGIRNVTLELGGKAPAVVMEDADLDTTIEWLMMGGFYGAGQVCSATSRVLVHRSIHAEVRDRLVANARRLRLGHALAEDVDMGPLVSKKQFDRVMAYITGAKEAGITCVTGGKPYEEIPGCVTRSGAHLSFPRMLFISFSIIIVFWLLLLSFSSLFSQRVLCGANGL